MIALAINLQVAAIVHRGRDMEPLDHGLEAEALEFGQHDVGRLVVAPIAGDTTPKVLHCLEVADDSFDVNTAGPLLVAALRGHRRAADETAESEYGGENDEPPGRTKVAAVATVWHVDISPLLLA